MVHVSVNVERNRKRGKGKGKEKGKWGPSRNIHPPFKGITSVQSPLCSHTTQEVLRAEQSPVWASWLGDLGQQRRLITLTCKWATFRKGGRLRRWGWWERWEGEAEQWSLLMIDPNESGLLKHYSEGKPQKSARLTSLPILGTWVLLYILNAHVPWNAKVELI